MPTFIDRRLNPKDKSLGNRQRFLRRVREDLKRSVREQIRTGKISDVDAEHVVPMPDRGTGEPRFENARDSGQRQHVLPGNREFNPGDRIAKPGQGGEAHRPYKLLYALAYREDPVKPTFVVDISDVFETKMQAIRCYASQFDGAKAAGEIHPTGQDLYELIRVQSAHYGSLIRRRYGEPFYTPETQEVNDVLKLGVQSI